MKCWLRTSNQFSGLSRAEATEAAIKASGKRIRRDMRRAHTDTPKPWLGQMAAITGENIKAAGVTKVICRVHLRLGRVVTSHVANHEFETQFSTAAVHRRRDRNVAGSLHRGGGPGPATEY